MSGRQLSRRRFLAAAGGTAAALALPGCGLRETTGELVTSAGRRPSPFGTRLPVPPVARPVRQTADTDFYEIVQRVADVEIIPGRRTQILGYDGIFPGPTIVSRSGRRTVVTHRNELTVPTVVHLHGGHVPAESDGFPTDLVLPVGMHEAPGHSSHAATGAVKHGTFDYSYPMDQRAATLWYHDHRMDFTGPGVYRGLAGFHLVQDDEEESLGLPHGEKDIPLMIVDRAFDEDGAFAYPAIDSSMLGEPGVEDAFMEGVIGDVILVNGAPWPVLEVATTRYRFRLLNASNARRYELALSPPPPGTSFVQVGSDGGLLAEPVRHDVVRMAPAERFDVVIDFSSYEVGSEITMINALGDGSTSQVMRFVVIRGERDDSTVPARLGEVERLDERAAQAVRSFRFHRGPSDEAHWTINGLAYDPSRVDASPQLGTVERWRVVTDVHHPVHVHLDPFQVVKRSAGGPGAFDAGWKDTVDVRPGEVVEVLVRFTDHAGRYVMHCHNLEHEDMMMMANFQTH